jgi:hypothetical protein
MITELDLQQIEQKLNPPVIICRKHCLSYEEKPRASVKETVFGSILFHYNFPDKLCCPVCLLKERLRSKYAR